MNSTTMSNESKFWLSSLLIGGICTFQIYKKTKQAKIPNIHDDKNQLFPLESNEKLIWTTTKPMNFANAPKFGTFDYQFWLDVLLLHFLWDEYKTRRTDFEWKDGPVVIASKLKASCIESPPYLKIQSLEFVFNLMALSWGVRKICSTLARFQSNRYKAPATLDDYIQNANPARRSKRILIVGTGISGLSALKQTLAEGYTPVCFEQSDIKCGFWRYRKEMDQPSVYESTHIDVERDMAGFADIPWNPKVRLTIKNDIMTSYMEQMCDYLNLDKYIRYGTRVISVKPFDRNEQTLQWRWLVEFERRGEGIASEVFDGCIIATGRHGGGAVVPEFKNLSKFKNQHIHSSQFKEPALHNIVEGKKVVVVGIGNSGLDVVTEVSPISRDVILVSRSGAWVNRVPHGDVSFSINAVGDRISLLGFLNLPWMILTEIFEQVGLMALSDMKKDQAILNKHGLTPKHRMYQQHTLFTGLNGRATLHDELENGNIKVKTGIQEFTETGIIFTDGSVAENVDLVVFATGYKQQQGFVDPRVIDLRFHRKGNDALLYKSIFPCNEFGASLGFINMQQTITFLSGDLQCRAFFAVFNQEKQLPTSTEMEEETKKIRNTTCAQFIDRSQLRGQVGLFYAYYEDLAEFIGCEPSLWKILKERPTALWHAFFTRGLIPLQYRLVGRDRLEIAEQWLEEQYLTKHYSPTYPDGTKKITPNDRDGVLGLINQVKTYAIILSLRGVARALGYVNSVKVQDALEQNLKYAKDDIEKRGIPHSLDLNEIPVMDRAYNGVLSVWGKI